MKKSNKILLWVIAIITLCTIPFIYMAIVKRKKVAVQTPNFGSDQTRGIKNNNPLNLRQTNIDWKHESGKDFDSAFEEFDSMVWGLRAGLRNMRTWFERGNQTIEKIISVWAPESENDTESYIQYVSEKSGIPRDAVIEWEKDTFYPIVAAMCKIESQFDCDYELYKDAWNKI